MNDIIGKKFGRWIVLKFIKSVPRFYKNGSIMGHKHYYLCRCECGTEKIVVGENLKSGKSKSCGCLKKDFPNFICHGLRNTRLYDIWSGMKARCYNKNHSSYKNYGARGIEVCDEWKNDFQTFYNWAMTNGYNENAKRGNFTLDRINNNKKYSPKNCRWVSQSVQNNNTRRNKIIKFKNEIHTIKEWSIILSIPYSTLTARLNKYKWSIEKTLTTPVH